MSIYYSVRMSRMTKEESISHVHISHIFHQLSSSPLLSSPPLLFYLFFFLSPPPFPPQMKRKRKKRKRKGEIENERGGERQKEETRR